MPDKPVVLAEFGSGPSMLVLTHLSGRKLRRDLLVLVEEGLEPARRETSITQTGSVPVLHKAWGTPRGLST